MLRSVTATTGSSRFESWFQIPVIATARATSPDSNPQARRRPKEPAIPTSPPPGAMYVNAVDAWVNGSACRNGRPGSASIQGGAYVTMLRTTTPASRRSHFASRLLTISQTSP